MSPALEFKAAKDAWAESVGRLYATLDPKQKNLMMEVMASHGRLIKLLKDDVEKIIKTLEI